MSGANMASNSIPASAINGGVGGSALSSADQTARSATQIGYQLSYTGTYNLSQGSGFITLKTLTLSPQNSVWILNGYQTCSTQINNFDWKFYGFSTGSSFNYQAPLPNGAGSAGNANSGASTHNAVEGIYGFGLGFPVCCVYTVPTSSQSISYGIGMAWEASPFVTTPQKWTVTATRIA